MALQTAGGPELNNAKCRAATGREENVMTSVGISYHRVKGHACHSPHAVHPRANQLTHIDFSVSQHLFFDRRSDFIFSSVRVAVSAFLRGL